MNGTNAAEVLAVASHELRAPLTSLVGFAETLRDRRHELSDDDVDACVAAIDRQAHRLADLVEDLLAAAMTETGTDALTLGAVDPAGAVHDALADVGVDRGHEVVVTIADGLPPVAAHAGSLRRVLVNLLANAQRYSPRGSRIDVGVDDTGDGVALSVRDHGAGIASADLSRVFRPFQRGPKAPAGSCGIGLYVVQRLVDAMGGRITVDTQPGPGTCFTVVLAYHRSDASAPAYAA